MTGPIACQWPEGCDRPDAVHTIALDLDVGGEVVPVKLHVCHRHLGEAIRRGGMVLAAEESDG